MINGVCGESERDDDGEVTSQVSPEYGGAPRRGCRISLSLFLPGESTLPDSLNTVPLYLPREGADDDDEGGDADFHVRIICRYAF